MARKPQPADLWPKWLHFGCLGLSAAVALAFMATGLGFALYAHASAAKLRPDRVAGRTSPVVRLADGVVSVVRLEGYDTWGKAWFLDDHHMLCSGSLVPSLGTILSKALAGPTNIEERFDELIRTHIFLVADDTPPREVPLPLPTEYFSDPDDVLPSADGRQAAVVLTTYEPGSGLVDVRSVEVWLLDISSLGWKRLASLPSGQQVHLGCWLPDGRGLVCFVSSDRARGTTVWRLALDGNRANLCHVDGYIEDVIYDQTEGCVYMRWWKEGTEKIGTFVDRLDPVTGARKTSKVVELVGTHPGPIQRTEILTEGLQVLDWKAARLRTLAPADDVWFRGKATPDGRWLLAYASPARESEGNDSEDRNALLVALNLTDGRFHKLSKTRMTVCDVDSTGRRALASQSLSYEAFLPDPSKARLVELYLDWQKIAASPGTTDPKKLFGKAASAPSSSKPRRSSSGAPKS